MEVEEREDMVTRGQSQVNRIEIFRESGPVHLTSPDWNNSYYRTAVASCLVQAVYILERDRQENRSVHESQAHHWWEFFNFTLNQRLMDPEGSIYGAVFYYKHFDHYHNTPRQVIAFRGTIVTPKTRLYDLWLNGRVLCGSLHKSRRFTHAIDVIQRAVKESGNAAVWLAGHSLGAAVALVAGKIMMRSGSPLETYLFNSPFPSIPIEMVVMNEKLEHGVRYFGSLVKAGVAIAFNGRHHYKGQEDDSFMRLGSWRPYLCLNAADPICSGYIGYFNHREIMFENGAGKIENIATRISLISLITGGGEGERSSSPDSSSLPLHLLPSAYLITNCNRKSYNILPSFKEGHGLQQWWDHKCNGEFVLHQFNQ